jgi:O-antigen/teichoic acid export membrane protein
MTILSVLSWIGFFDIGLGNGMKNNVTEALSLNNKSLVKSYSSTTYILMSVVAAFIFLLVLMAIPFLNCNTIFNTMSIPGLELKIVFVLAVLFFLLNFVLSLITQLLSAYQRTSLVALIQLISNALALIMIYLLMKTKHVSLIALSIAYGSSLVVANVIIGHYFFKDNPEAMPSVKGRDFSVMNKVISLGMQFFVIQIVCLVIFTTDNFIITQIFGPSEVTSYNIVYKLFSIFTIGYGIIAAPLWSAYTEAYTKGDFKWIRHILTKLNIMMIPLCVAVALVAYFAKDIIRLWIGKNYYGNNVLIIFMAIFIIISIWNNNYALFVNGIGKIKLQMYTAIIAGIINIPISVYFAKSLHYGSGGVILGTVVSLSIFAIVGPIQTYFLLKDKA